MLKDRFTKVTERAAHVDMIVGAMAQHVTSVRQWLQEQAVRVLEPVDLSIDASEQHGWSVTVRERSGGNVLPRLRFLFTRGSLSEKFTPAWA